MDPPFPPLTKLLRLNYYSSRECDYHSCANKMKTTLMALLLVPVLNKCHRPLPGD